MIAKLDECIIKKNKNRNSIFLRQRDLINTFRVINSIFIYLYIFLYSARKTETIYILKRFIVTPK